MPKVILIIQDENLQRTAATMDKINKAEMVLIKRNELFYVSKNLVDGEFKDRTIDDIGKIKSSNKYIVEEI